MVFVLKKPAQELTAEEIRQIFATANDCYNFGLDTRDMKRAENYLTQEGISLLRQRKTIDYRPWMGGKILHRTFRKRNKNLGI